ncbi:FAD/FMN-containing dehydrogenase [Amycolatopsis cihanbeyliensis]|uniref:FAD/FMN-containing dehydrogenase n=1 Tax=Amycolatopsis cihanbeyliensis TaxID=1128664 RepID=A0A542DEN4_AMYCI|nr:FAD/FMN-containing dehydrogenase [Amycolatopsis cihanbeyliensis]
MSRRPSPSRAGETRRRFGPVVVPPEDPRYADLVLRRTNDRFRPEPGSFHVVGSSRQVERAVGEAVRAGKRVTVRSGGHCYENFVGAPSVDVVIDMAELNAVYFDPTRSAFAVEPGATLMKVFQTLYLGWGVTIPGGQCGTVAAGGHIQGGGYGPLSRSQGSVVDYLHAVEVVVVDRRGRAHTVVATRDPRDPWHDLWWAHTGGGGGNFGVVTRYWFRAPDARGTDPTRLLPAPPARVRGGALLWRWRDMPRESFRKLLRNHGEWHERHSAPDSPYADLFASLQAGTRTDENAPGSIVLACQVDDTKPGSAQRLRDALIAISGDVGGTPLISEPEPWLTATRRGVRFTSEEAGRYKGKAAYLRRRFTDAQIETAYARLIDPEPRSAGALLWLLSYGGAVNAVPPAATAVPQRDSILKVIYLNSWTGTTEADEAANLAWIRRFYREMYADTGGVPVPNEVNDGSYVNYPDIDLADPEWNTSGVPWHALYYKDNYERLQRVKARWDPRNVFHHALSVRPPRSDPERG